MNATRNWADRLAENWTQLKVADKALQVEKDTRRQAITEHAIRAAYQQAGMAPPPLEDEPVAVSVGDTYHNHQTKAATSPLKSMAAGVLAAAAGAGGLLAAQELLKPADPPAAVEGIDTDTQYDFGLYTPQ